MIIDLVKKSQKNKLWNFIFKNFLKININNFLYPRIFIDKISKSKISLDELYEYKEKFPSNKWNDLAKKFENETYQSEHDLQKHKIFKKLKIDIENLLNFKIKPKLFNKKKFGKFIIKNMWFTIMEKNNSHHSHNHPKSVLSGVIYIKKRNSNDGMLKILLPKDNISEYSKKILNKFQNTKAVLSDFRYVPEKKKELNEKIFIFNPKENEIIIFNSYLYHWVDKYNDTEDRISIAWDAIYTL